MPTVVAATVCVRIRMARPVQNLPQMWMSGLPDVCVRVRMRWGVRKLTQTWWHWADGNISQEGITAELEAMKRIGLGGVHMFTVGNYPPVPNPKVPCLSPAWYGMVRHALAECGRLGLAKPLA